LLLLTDVAAFAEHVADAGEGRFHHVVGAVRVAGFLVGHGDVQRQLL
jgi:hypothetical protein